MSKKCTALCREAHLEVKMLQAPHVWHRRPTALYYNCNYNSNSYYDYDYDDYYDYYDYYDYTTTTTTTTTATATAATSLPLYRGGVRGGDKTNLSNSIFLLGNPGIVIQPLKWNCEVTFLNKPWALVRKYLRLAPEELSASI